ncbi:MAG: HAMP domain-containing sensor histidine kinase [Acidobacteriota bacterium]|nr:HAMP domain-containing sensor histidine kinase [Acidobacteriota bacterium]
MARQPMGITRWLRPPGRTLAVFLCLMLVLAGALSWLGWQWLRQDRALEGQRFRDRLELAVDQMAVAMQRDLTELEGYLGFVSGPGAKAPPDGIWIMQGTKSAVDAFPIGGLLYFSTLPDAAEPSAAVFAAGEALEHQRNDPAKAAAVFRELARSPEAGVRAGAWLRLGRNLRKIGRPEEALRVYDELARLGATPVLGLPAELLAREARGSVFEAMGRGRELAAEAALLRASLWSGRWRLLRPAWEFYRGEAQRWLGAVPSTEQEQDRHALSIAADRIYEQWRTEPESKGRRILKINERPVLAVWTGTSDRLTVVLAGPDHLGSKWTAALQGRQVQGALIDADGLVILGSFNKSGPRAVRTAAETRLPGTLHATSPDPGAVAADVSGRRRLLYGGFAVLALTLLAGSFSIIRSIKRERAVAGLQSEFVSAVSHEFRTPLTSLRQLSEMLAKDRIPDDQDRRKSYDILSQETERLQKLVESLLDFGRIEAGTLRYHFEPLDPGAWLGGVVAEFQEKAAARGYRIELHLAGGLPRIHADRESLGLALRNLLDNAVKYSPECPTVWVEAARERDRLAIRVRDQGMGIPASEQKAVFKRFVRGSGSRAAHIQGTGIGLALARHIVEAHDGEIHLQSEPGKGSTFTILLPLEKKA